MHDHATLNSGSFAATIRGFSLLKEAGSGFNMQIIPMKDSYHQMEEMIALVKSLSPHYHLGSMALFVCWSKIPCGMPRQMPKDSPPRCNKT